MKVPIRTLSPQDAEILARTTENGVVSNGCVERHGLRWRSDALRTWEVSQRSLGRKPEVSIRIDELDLSVVYVEFDDVSRQLIKATSTQPLYTHRLSLYEHKKLKEELKKRELKDRLVQMKDDEAFQLRIQYHAALGHADDPVAYRRLVGLRDQLAALRAGNTTSVEATSTRPRSDSRATPKERTRKDKTEQPQDEIQPAPETNLTQSQDSRQPPATSPTPAAAETQTKPSRIFIKRKPK